MHALLWAVAGWIGVAAVARTFQSITASTSLECRWYLLRLQSTAFTRCHLNYLALYFVEAHTL